MKKLCTCICVKRHSAGQIQTENVRRVDVLKSVNNVREIYLLIRCVFDSLSLSQTRKDQASERLHNPKTTRLSFGPDSCMIIHSPFPMAFVFRVMERPHSSQLHSSVIFP